MTLRYEYVDSVYCVSTIYHERMPLNERRLRRAQEEDSVSNLIRRAHSSHRCYVNSRSERFNHLRGRRRHRRLDHTRTHTIYADSFFRIVDGIGSRHIDDSGLGSTVCSYLEVSEQQ